MAAFPWHWSPPDVTAVRKLQHRTDEQLAAAVLVGDELATGALYDRLQPAIDQALRRVLHCRFEDFDGLVQQVFERVLSHFARAPGEPPRDLSSWAAALAGQVALEALRREHQRRFFARDRTDRTVRNARAVRSNRRRETLSEVGRLHDILVRMRPRLADALVLRDVLGCVPAEIAAVTGTSRRTTRSRLIRARRELVRRAMALSVRREHP